METQTDTVVPLPTSGLSPLAGIAASTATPMPADLLSQTIVDMVVYEHNKVRSLYLQYKSNPLPEQRQMLVWEITRDISQHNAKEEMVLYPVLAAIDPEIRNHLTAEHKQMEQLLAIVDSGNIQDEGVANAFEQCMITLMHHMQEEEQRYLPALATQVGLYRLKELGMHFHSAALGAPTRPHPEAADVPPVNLSMNPKLLIADLAADLLRFGGVAHTGMSTVPVPMTAEFVATVNAAPEATTAATGITPAEANSTPISVSRMGISSVAPGTATSGVAMGVPVSAAGAMGGATGAAGGDAQMQGEQTEAAGAAVTPAAAVTGGDK